MPAPVPSLIVIAVVAVTLNTLLALSLAAAAGRPVLPPPRRDTEALPDTAAPHRAGDGEV